MGSNKSILILAVISILIVLLMLAIYTPKEATLPETKEANPVDLSVLYVEEQTEAVANETSKVIEIVTPPSIEKMITPPSILEEEDEKEKIISFDLKSESQTGTANVRSSAIAANLDLKVTEQSKLGLGVSTLRYDEKDAKAWKEDRDSTEEAIVKYQMAF